VISGKSKKKLQEYEQEYVSGMFRSADETTFNGLDNDDISRSRDIYFLFCRHVYQVYRWPQILRLVSES